MEKSEVEPRKIFVGGLSPLTTKEKLGEYFSKYGPVTDAVVMKDSVTQNSRGFGFVTFTDEDSKIKALSESNHKLDSKKIDPKVATVKNQPPSNKKYSEGDGERQRKIFVGGIPKGASEDDLKTCFSIVGKVTAVDLKMDKHTTQPRGFGFVEFEDHLAAESAVKIHYHEVNAKKVEAKWALGRENVHAPTSSGQPSYSYSGGTTGSNDYSAYDYAQYSYSQQQAPQQQQSYYGYGHHQGYSQQTFPATAVPYNQGDHQYGAAAGGQQGSVSAIHGQHVTPYNQGTAGYSSTAHQAAYPNSEGFNQQSFQPSYSDRSQGTQSSAYQQYDSQSASNYNHSMVQRSNYDYSAS